MKSRLFRIKSLTFPALATLVCLVAYTANAADSIVVVSHIWARETPRGASTAAVFLTITNRGNAADRLIAADTEIASKAAIHAMTMHDGMMEMRDVKEGLSIPANSSTVLAPGSHHIMLTGIKKPLTPGGSFDVSLHFAEAGIVKATVAVKPLGYSEKE